MSLRLADRVTAARRRRFVGRLAEMARFKPALTAAEMPFQWPYVYGSQRPPAARPPDLGYGWAAAHVWPAARAALARAS